MALTGSTWPTTLMPASCKFGRDRQEHNLSSPHDRSRQIIRRGRPLWMAEVEWRLRPELVSEWRYWIDGLEGQAGNIIIWDFASDLKTTPGTPLVKTAGSIGDTSVATKGWTASTTVLQDGGWIQFGTRLYIASGAVTSNGSGDATVTLSRPLLSAVSVNQTLKIVNAGCEMRLVDSQWSGSRSIGTGLWPSSLIPMSCTFGRSRNPFLQISQTSRHAIVSERGRPLWFAECEWELLPSQIPLMRRTMEAMQGQASDYIIWDFANSYPTYSSAITMPAYPRWSYSSSRPQWTYTSIQSNWVYAGVDYTSFESSLRLIGSSPLGATSIAVSGFPPDTLVLARGDFIGIGEGLYLVGAAVTSNAAGGAIITLTTPLLTAATYATTITLTAAGCPMYRVDSNWESARAWDDGLLHVSAKFLEVF
jgi:hypothetical protein